MSGRQWLSGSGHFIGFLLIVVIILPLKLLPNQNLELEKKYEKWIKEEVIYIITPIEKEVFYKLETDRDRDLFIDEFWRQRDPTPGSPRNEFKEEHYRRIEYTNKTFGRGTPIKGWRTDRGRFYIKLGRPASVEKYMGFDIYPIETWIYSGSPKFMRVPFFRLVFFQRHGTGEFELYNPILDGLQSLVIFFDENKELPPALEGVALSARPGDRNTSPLESQMIIGEAETIPFKKVDDSYAYEFLEHKAVVEVSYSAHYMGNQSRVSIIRDPSGLFFVNYILVPETLSVDFFKDKYFTHLKTSVRVADQEGKTIFQGERNIPIELREEELKIIEKNSFHLHDSFPLIPGDYTFNLLLENMVTKEFTSVEKKISVPAGKNLQMSSLILARKINKDLPPSEKSTAFQVGNLKIYPSADNTFLKKNSLFLFFQIYGLSRNLKEKGTLEFSFYKEDQYFLTIHKKLNEYNSDRDFLEEISLEKFEPGVYSVKVSLHEEGGEEFLSQSEELTISKKPFPGAWVVAQTNPSTDDPYYSYILGIQFLNKGDIQKAYKELSKAYERKPDDMNYALSYARVLLTLKNFPRVREILIPLVKTEKENFGLFYSLGKASQEISEFKEAISYYQTALRLKGPITLILNAIGECYLQLGETGLALKAFEKSLETDPSQESIRKKIEDIKKNTNTGNWFHFS